jgi:hypothetical protein
MNISLEVVREFMIQFRERFIKLNSEPTPNNIAKSLLNMRYR